MDLVHDDAEVICPGSGSAGVSHKNVAENKVEYVYYECPSCGTLLPKSPIKKHHRINRGNR
jgi:uncharacterized Zn finger protein